MFDFSNSILLEKNRNIDAPTESHRLTAAEFHSVFARLGPVPLYITVAKCLREPPEIRCQQLPGFTPDHFGNTSVESLIQTALLKPPETDCDKRQHKDPE